MGIFRTILDLFRPRPTVNRPAAVAKTTEHQVATPALKPALHEPVAPEQPQQIVHLTIHLLSQADGTLLQTPSDISGVAGTHLDYAPPHLPGYLFYRAEGLSRLVPQADTSIKLYYQPMQAAPVTIYHRGPAGELIAPPETLLGIINTAFTAHALTNRRDDVIGNHTQSGLFSLHAQSIRFNYQMAGIETGDLPNAAYIEIARPKNVYPTPNAPHALSMPLPSGTVWQVFGIVRQQQTHQVWFNLGAQQWVSAQATRPHKTNPFLTAPAEVQPAAAHFKETVTPLQDEVTIDGPAIGVTVWDKPYGQPQALRLQNGSRFTPVAQHTLDNGSVWIELSSHVFIEASYCSFSMAVK